MILRVVTMLDEDEKLVGTMEAEEAPAVGDLFYWKQHGPLKVVSRTWHLPPGYADRQETMTLVVEFCSLGASLGHALTGAILLEP